MSELPHPSAMGYLELLTMGEGAFRRRSGSESPEGVVE